MAARQSRPPAGGFLWLGSDVFLYAKTRDRLDQTLPFAVSIIYSAKRAIGLSQVMPDPGNFGRHTPRRQRTRHLHTQLHTSLWQQPDPVILDDVLLHGDIETLCVFVDIQPALM